MLSGQNHYVTPTNIVLYNNAVKTADTSDTRNVSLAIISEMESARAMPVVKSNGVRKERQIYKVGYAHENKSNTGPVVKIYEEEQSRKVVRYCDYCAIYECAGIKPNAEPRRVSY